MGDPRWFVATRSDVGVIYVKPYLSAGYGMPHWIWAGVDLNALSTTETLQVYSGVRASTPIFDLAFGVRDTWSYFRPFLEPSDSYTHSAIVDAPGDNARYWAYELEAVSVVPLPYSAIIANFVAIGTLDVPKGSYVYDEAYRLVVADSLFFALRLGAVARFLNENSLKVGVLVEHLFGTGRDEPVTRFGPVGALQLTDHLEINAALTFAVSSPDHLGIFDGTYGVAGFRYRWATGERNPQLPWKGDLIP